MRAKKKILLLLGHPDRSGLCGAIADTYEKAARAAGHEVTRFNVDELHFDPDLHHGYRIIQELEPDLERFCNTLHEADHFVVVHPVWWFGMPAATKGLFDRVWLPGSAFRYIKHNGVRTIFWTPMYRDKTARVIATSGSHPLLVRIFYGNPHAQLKYAILWFAGFSVRTALFGPAENPSASRKARWLGHVHRWGTDGR